MLRAAGQTQVRCENLPIACIGRVGGAHTAGISGGLSGVTRVHSDIHRGKFVYINNSQGGHGANFLRAQGVTCSSSLVWSKNVMRGWPRAAAYDSSCAVHDPTPLHSR